MEILQIRETEICETKYYYIYSRIKEFLVPNIETVSHLIGMTTVELFNILIDQYGGWLHSNRVDPLNVYFEDRKVVQKILDDFVVPRYVMKQLEKSNL